MNEFAKKLFLAGLGLAATTEEKAKSTFNELIQKGDKLQSKEAQFLKELMDSTDKTASEFSEKFEDFRNEFIQKMNLVSRDEHEKLLDEVNTLKKIISEMDYEKLDREIKDLKNEISEPE
jgi:poly(hydroxyalkanoate) granule-associated protein